MALVSKSDLTRIVQKSIPRVRPKDAPQSEEVVKKQQRLRDQARDYMKRFQ